MGNFTVGRSGERTTGDTLELDTSKISLLEEIIIQLKINNVYHSITWDDEITEEDLDNA